MYKCINEFDNMMHSLLLYIAFSFQESEKIDSSISDHEIQHITERIKEKVSEDFPNLRDKIDLEVHGTTITASLLTSDFKSVKKEFEVALVNDAFEHYRNKLTDEQIESLKSQVDVKTTEEGDNTTIIVELGGLELPEELQEESD